MNPFIGEAVAARYEQARPALHHHVTRLLADRLPRPRRALDIGCGTGLSTEALASFADAVVGIDVSEAMLLHRSRDDGRHYVRAAAEQLPFRDALFELATVASAIHWLDSDAFQEIGRVLTPTASAAVYDVWFRAEMRGVDGFASWMSGECSRRYRRVPKHEYDETIMAVAGLHLAWEKDLRFDVPMALDQLADYLMTHSERIAAIREGAETEAQQHAFLTDGLAPFFADATVRHLGLGIQVAVFKR